MSKESTSEKVVWGKLAVFCPVTGHSWHVAEAPSGLCQQSYFPLNSNRLPAALTLMWTDDARWIGSNSRLGKKKLKTEKIKNPRKKFERKSPQPPTHRRVTRGCRA
jgi:hypothetical protein